MSFKCPGCDAVHETVEGYVSKEVMTQRLGTKNTEIAALKTLAEAAGDVGAIRAERDRLAGEVEALKEQGVIDAAFAEHKIPAEARDGFRAIYNSQMADKAEGERQAYTEWLASDEAKGHVLLKGHYGTGDGNPAPATPAAPATNPAGPATVNTDTGTNPPTNAPALIGADDLASYFKSPQYRDLPRDKQKEQFQRLQTEFKAGTLTAITPPG